MKRTIQISIILLGLFISVSSNLYSQGFRVKYFDDNRNEGALAYNFFIGDEADLFQTTIKGFGSGFLLDIFTGRNSVSVLSLGWDKVNLSFGVGFALTKYRFENNLMLEMDNNGIVQYGIDPNPNHDYVNTFFGYGKSKIVYGSFFLPVNLNVTLGDILLSGGGLLDFYISGKHKRKYIEDGDEVVIKVGDDDFRNYDISKTKVGMNGYIKHIPTGINVSVTYFFTPFFSEDYLPTLNEMRIAFGIDIGKSYLDKIKKKAKITKQV